jgi:hypothetical protein
MLYMNIDQNTSVYEVLKFSLRREDIPIDIERVQFEYLKGKWRINSQTTNES